MRLIDAHRLYGEMTYDWGTMDSEEFEKAVFERITNAPTVNQWIAVTDRLPDKADEYLCVDKDGEYEVGLWHPRLKHFFFNSCSDIGKPIAWMELPPAYKEETDE